MSEKLLLGLSRRQVIRGLLATTAFGVTVKFGTGCTSEGSEQAAADSGTGGGDGQPITIGFIYVGSKDDYGYNQAHAQGAQGMVDKFSGQVNLVEQASVPETTEVQEAMRSMIDTDGAIALFPTSFGYFDPHIIKVAEEYPEVQFFHAGGLYNEGLPDNIGSYFGYIDEAQYIAGIVAAMTSRSGKLGFVGAKPIPQVLRNINSYTLGARSVKPEVTTQVIFTGNWAEPIKEAEATNSMVDQGIDVVTCHVDSPKVVMETAEKRGIYCTGYHADQSALAPKGYLTGAEWDWTNIYSKIAEDILAGKTLVDGGIEHILRGGLKEGFCKLSAYGSAVSADTQKAADDVLAQFMDGSMVIYKGELKDNQGNVVIASGQEMKQLDPKLEEMNYLVEGVSGSIGS
ncbi:MAG: BMP family ABC transporter substrate-binding protein [Cyanobacteria bacterium CRU_2_1]|nr:BMP family ABC transporter substrate-binding protein [Cyanobacteria bacterium RU_5_0]NJR60379.1 BMP family ABC transporter substrate-binding protein [Cyanobacteria bacterium CRU_2_1]